MKKILVSLSVIVAVGAVVAGATGAFFSDTETSSGNTFTAGAIDLKIDNESYATDFTIPGYPEPTGALVASPGNSWELKDLDLENFFNFVDLKPGDMGEDTISIHVNNNDAWVCAAARVTADDDNSITEPEEEDGDEDEAPGLDLGELDEELNFMFWADDGDNVLEISEQDKIFLEGTLEQMGAAGQIALADSLKNVWTGLPNDPLEGSDPGEGLVHYIGKAWCYGDLTADAEEEGVGTPVERGPGVKCNGENVDNQSQTDSVEGDLQFYAVQSRNNGEFSCVDDYTPVWPTPPTPQE